MIQEAFVSEQTKKLLEEKGFPFASLNRNGKRNGNWCTQQMATRWLREKYNILIEINPWYNETEDLTDVILAGWGWTLFNLSTDSYIKEIEDDGSLVNTYEEATEAAIKYCLENLIK